MEFITLTIVSILALIFIVRFSLSSRKPNPINNVKIIGILLILVVFCMLLGKYGATWGFPWWIYYPIPMLIIIFFPMIYFKMKNKETVKYLVITFVSGPLIHIIFSLLGWKNYMPFIKIPSIWELFN